MDIMAIDSAQVPAMDAAVEAYINEVETCITNIRAFEVGPGSGFYGTDQCNTINNYVEETCTQINQIVRYFDDFKAALAEVSAAYIAQSQAVTVDAVKEAATNDGDLITVNRMN